MQPLWIQRWLEHERKIRNKRGQPYDTGIQQNLLKDPHYILFKVHEKSGISQWVLLQHIIAHTATQADINVQRTPQPIHFLPLTMNPHLSFAIMPFCTTEHPLCESRGLFKPQKLCCIFVFYCVWELGWRFAPWLQFSVGNCLIPFSCMGRQYPVPYKEGKTYVKIK